MDFKNNMPIYKQIVRKIKEDIALGVYSPGQQFQSVRDLASEMKVNPNTIQRSIAELVGEDYLFSKRGVGNFVTQDQASLNELKEDLVKGHIKTFTDSMQRLGFSKDEIISKMTEVLK